jgi:hypothetical protein
MDEYAVSELCRVEGKGGRVCRGGIKKAICDGGVVEWGWVCGA